MRQSRLAFVALMLCATAVALPAQGRQGPPRPPRPGMADSTRGPRPGGMRGPDGPVDMLLRQKDKFNLSSDQITSLEAIRASNANLAITPAEMRQLRADLETATRGDANIEAARAAMTKLNQAETDAFIARLQARSAARAVLNADQRAQFDAIEAQRPPQGGGRGGPLPAAGVRRGPPPPPAQN